MDDPIEGDWFSSVKEDLSVFGLDYLDLSDIKTMKKNEFKKLVKTHSKDATLKFLLDGNDEKTKLKKLCYYRLETQPYLLSEKLSTKSKQCLFKFRTHMVNDSSNFGGTKTCKFCNMNELDNQEHMFNCVIMKLRCKELYNMIDIKYNDIFTNETSKLIKIAKVCHSLLRTREILLQETDIDT